MSNKCIEIYRVKTIAADECRSPFFIKGLHIDKHTYTHINWIKVNNSLETGWWFEQMIWRQIGAGSIWQLIFIANTRLHFYRILLVSEWMSVLFLFKIPTPSSYISRVSSINYHYPVFYHLLFVYSSRSVFTLPSGHQTIVYSVFFLLSNIIIIIMTLCFRTHFFTYDAGFFRLFR